MFTGEHLKRIRKARGLRQSDLAKAVFRSDVVISEMESDDKHQRVFRLIERACAALNITPNDFFNWESVNRIPVINRKPKVSASEFSFLKLLNTYLDDHFTYDKDVAAHYGISHTHVCYMRIGERPPPKQLLEDMGYEMQVIKERIYTKKG